MSRFFLYLLATVYVTVLSGSVLTSVEEIIDNPAHGLLDIGTNISGVSSYWLIFVLSKAVWLPISLVRWGPALRILWRWLQWPLRGRPSQAELLGVAQSAEGGDPTNYYVFLLPPSLLVLVIAATYAPVAPLLSWRAYSTSPSASR